MFQFLVYCFQAFEKICKEAGVLELWQSMSEQDRLCLLDRIIDRMEVNSVNDRAEASRALLYIAQVSLAFLNIIFLLPLTHDVQGIEHCAV